MDVENVVGALCFFEQLLVGQVLGFGVAHDGPEGVGLEHVPGGLVADGEQETLLAALLEAVARGVPGRKQPGQGVRLAALAPAVALQVQAGQPLVKLGGAALKLAHLQRVAVGMMVADAAEQNLRMRHAVVDERVHQRAQLFAHQHFRNAAHAAGFVQKHGNGQRIGVNVGVAAFAKFYACGQHLVAGAAGAVVRENVIGAGPGPGVLQEIIRIVRPF